MNSHYIVFVKELLQLCHTKKTIIIELVEVDSSLLLKSKNDREKNRHMCKALSKFSSRRFVDGVNKTYISLCIIRCDFVFCFLFFFILVFL